MVYSSRVIEIEREYEALVLSFIMSNRQEMLMGIEADFGFIEYGI